jgi:hypothetical protein
MVGPDDIWATAANSLMTEEKILAERIIHIGGAVMVCFIDIQITSIK